MEEKVLYDLPINVSRYLIPKIISLISLSVLFYLGILLNLSLLNLSGPTETSVKLGSVFVLLVLIVIGIFHNMSAAKHGYLFYGNRIKFARKTVTYYHITEINRKENFLDKKFKTHSLILSKKFKIQAIPNSVDLHQYIQQMIDYNKAQAHQ